MNKEELLYNEIYERTKDFGRVHFIKEIMNLQRENKQLKSVLSEVRGLIEEFNLGKYDYSIPIFRVQEILDKVGDK